MFIIAIPIPGNRSHSCSFAQGPGVVEGRWGFGYPNFGRSVLGCIEAVVWQLKVRFPACVQVLQDWNEKFAPLDAKKLQFFVQFRKISVNIPDVCEISLKFYQNRLNFLRKFHRNSLELRKIQDHFRMSVYFAEHFKNI